MVSNWSVSRDQILHSCERKYYFQYMVNARINSRDESLREIAFLKKLKNIHLWKGSILHDIISDYLNYNVKGYSISIDKLLNDYETNIKKQWECSYKKEYDVNKSKIGKGNIFALMEHEYDEELPDGLLYNTIDEIKNQFFKFYDWSEEYTLLKKIRTSSKHWIEPPYFGYNASAFNLDNIKIIAKVDLAIQNRDNSFEIFDWKTGKLPRNSNRISHDEFQAGVYQLWPNIELNYNLEDIKAHILYLSDETHKSYEINGNKKEYYLNLIFKSVMKINQLEIVKDDLSFNDLNLAISPKICNLCSFKRLCQREVQ